MSLRSVFQALSARQEELRGIKKSGQDTGRWLKSLSALGSRLRWRSHFAQKLHDQPAIEHDNMCRAYDVLRTDHDAAKLDAWARGCTGFPMVDACMRSLLHSGWLNFRMRAMLVSFACYDLWLDWRPLAPILARCFLDYEPGIHYPQLQMQAGTTGMNALRIYSATKQVAHQNQPKHRLLYYSDAAHSSRRRITLAPITSSYGAGCPSSRACPRATWRSHTPCRPTCSAVPAA